VRFVRVGAGPVRAIVDREAAHRRRWLIATAAGVAALAAIVLAVLLWPGGGSDSTPFVDEGSTVPGTTVTVPTTTAAASAIVAAPIPVEGASPSPYGDGPLLALSAGEMWTFVNIPVGPDAFAVQIGHLEDGTWTLWRLTPVSGRCRRRCSPTCRGDWWWPRTAQCGRPPMSVSSPSTARSGPGGSTTRPGQSPSTTSDGVDQRRAGRQVE